MRSIRYLARGAVLSMALSGCTEPEPPGGGGSSRPSRSERARAEGAAVEGLDLQAMLTPVPEYEGRGRNLFAFGPARRTEAPVQAARPTPPPATSQTTTVPPRPAVTATRPDVRVNVKYAGFVEKTEREGTKAKYAIFLDGNEILAGAEGETIANRFTIVEIGLESVTVSAQGSSATQRIPLQAN